MNKQVPHASAQYDLFLESSVLVNNCGYSRPVLPSTTSTTGLRRESDADGSDCDNISIKDTGGALDVPTEGSDPQCCRRDPETTASRMMNAPT